MVTTEEIPRESWTVFCRNFSVLFQGWRVTLEVLRLDLGDQRVADGVPLQGLSYETQGGEAGDILIETGDSPEYIVHHIDQPRTVRLAIIDPGAEADVQFESEDGTTTLLCLRRRIALPPTDREKLLWLAQRLKRGMWYP